MATRTRSPERPLIPLAHSLSEITGPVFGDERVGELDHDLTRQHAGEPLGERIIVTAACSTTTGARCANTLSSSGRPTPPGATATTCDRHPAPLDPNFGGAGRCITDDEGRYRFVTIKPGAYPWRNHENAWRAGAHPLLALRAGVRARGS